MVAPEADFDPGFLGADFLSPAIIAHSRHFEGKGSRRAPADAHPFLLFRKNRLGKPFRRAVKRGPRIFAENDRRWAGMDLGSVVGAKRGGPGGTRTPNLAVMSRKTGVHGLP